MTSPLSPLHQALDALDDAWGSATDAASLPRPSLVEVNSALGAMRRRMEAVQAAVSAQIARESRTELGSQSLAKQQGFRSPSQMIASTMGTSAGEAARSIRVGEATASRVTLLGEEKPAKYPLVQRALGEGAIGANASAAIITLLDRYELRVAAEKREFVERDLIVKAPGLNSTQLGALVQQAEAWLDGDALRLREEERRAQRSLSMYERDGMLHLHAQLDVESAAPIKAAIEGYVSAQFAARQDAPAADAPDADRRSVVMIQADALTHLAEHALSCTTKDRVPMQGARVVIRVRMEDLASENGSGMASVDGLNTPISITTARKMAAGGSVLPWVCGGEGEVLEYGRDLRLFSPRQKLLLAERDGGCAMCGLPPGMTQAHHLHWWARDTGKTDLNDGVLLCTSCHHRIHDNGWNIRIEGIGVNAKVWFLPPPEVDPAQTPWLGGRARFRFHPEMAAA